MSEAVLTVLISSIVSLVGSALIVLASLKRAPAQNLADESSAGESNARAAVALNEGLVKRIDRLETELGETCDELEAERAARRSADKLAADSLERLSVLEDIVRDLQAKVLDISEQRDRCCSDRDSLQVERDLYQNWGQRLVGQLKSIDPDLVPVPVNKPTGRASK